jgi:hypothetical protein
MRTSTAYRYNSLEDFLISNPLEIDGILDDGQGALFPAKGRELDAAILFIDISNFAKRTLDLSPKDAGHYRSLPFDFSKH